MRNIKVKTTVFKYRDGEVEGYFKLSDGTTTKFSIDKDGTWFQWGNSNENLSLTVNKIERLKNKVSRL